MTSSGNSASQWRGVAGPVTFFADNWDVDETVAYNGIVATWNTNGNGSLRDQIQADSMCVATVAKKEGVTNSGSANVLFQPTWLQGPTGTVDPVPMYGVNATVGPRGGNNVVLWREEMMTDHPSNGWLYATQLQHTSVALEEDAYHIPSGQMAVFQVEDNGMLFQIGLSSTGHTYTAGAAGLEVSLSPETTFTFVGVFPWSYALMGPQARGAYTAI